MKNCKNYQVIIFIKISKQRRDDQRVAGLVSLQKPLVTGLRTALTNPFTGILPQHSLKARHRALEPNIPTAGFQSSWVQFPSFQQGTYSVANCIQDNLCFLLLTWSCSSACTLPMVYSETLDLTGECCYNTTQNSQEQTSFGLHFEMYMNVGNQWQNISAWINVLLRPMYA